MAFQGGSAEMTALEKDERKESGSDVPGEPSLKFSAKIVIKLK
jgi:hypothetical protein